jgi:hypothetical protein
MVEKVAEAEKKRDSRDSRPRNEKVKGVSSGPGRDPQDSIIQMLQEEGFLKEPSWHFVKGETILTQQPNKQVMAKPWVERGLSLPSSDFF